MKRPAVNLRNVRANRVVLLIALLVAAVVALTPAVAQNAVRDLRALDELVERNQQLTTENLRLTTEVERLRAEAARLKLELETLRKAKEDLETFIADYEEYGRAFEEYTFFREQAEREERAKRAAEARERREEQRRRQEEARERARQEREARTVDEEEDEVARRRMENLRRAGYTRVGDRVFVGHMGYAYRTESREEIRYNPLVDFWYIDRERKIDYTELTVSGSIIHAGLDERNISIALAFYDERGAQLGSTTVRVDGARPGVPYPFTSTVTMAANKPFRRYSSWVLYDDPSWPAPAPEPAPAPQPQP